MKTRAEEVTHLTLKELRESNKLTRTELCELLEVSLSSLVQYENGTRRPRPKVGAKIAMLFNLNEKELWDMFYAERKNA